VPERFPVLLGRRRLESVQAAEGGSTAEFLICCSAAAGEAKYLGDQLQDRQGSWSDNSPMVMMGVEKVIK
jgi:hypothetical protein